MPQESPPSAAEELAARRAQLPGPVAALDRGLDLMCRGISSACTALISVLLLGMVVAASVQVLSRYVIPGIVGGPEEAARLAMVSIVFLGLPVLARWSEHIRLDVAQESIPSAVVREWLSRFVLLAELVFLVVLTVLAVEFVADLATSSQKSPALGIQLFWSRLPVLVGSGLAVLVTAAVLARRLLGTAERPHDLNELVAS